MILENDEKEGGFFDTQKFQVIINPIANLFEVLKVDDYSLFVENNLLPTIVTIFQNTKDDFKWKTFMT